MTVKLSKDDNGRYRQVIRINQHTLYSDVAVSLGGDDSAPDPHDLYEASLASCKAITLLMYAKRKAIPLDSVDVEIERDTHMLAQGTYIMNVHLKLYGELDEQQRQSLALIADKCPIHKLITATTNEVRTTVS